MADPQLDIATHRRPDPKLPSELEEKLRICEATVARLASLQEQVERELTQVRRQEAKASGMLRALPPILREAASGMRRRLASRLAPVIRTTSRLLR